MGTRTIFTQRQAPSGDQWQEALHNALIAALPSKVAGVGGYAPTNQIIVIMDASATGDHENAALQIVANHDMTLRTEAQIIAASTPTDKERIALLEAAILELLEVVI